MIMKTTIRVAVCTIIACGYIGLASASETSESKVEVRTKTLAYSRTKVETELGAREFYSKLRHAAQQVCSDGAVKVGHMMVADVSCASTALDNAVSAVNVPAVYAIHGKAGSSIEVLAKR
jgi:UrcA family protein